MAKRWYFAQLDALRFLAFLSVFFAHSFFTESAAINAHPTFSLVLFLRRPGLLGVNFFFVLSGFLITYLLLEEKAATGRINIPHFYLRRILRIWPLYYSMLLVGFVGFPMLKRALGTPAVETAHPLPYLLFLGNFDVIANGTLPDATVLGVLWSLAVEEQFYLVWPLLLTVVPSRHHAKLFAVLILGSLIYRFVYFSDGLRIRFGTFAVISDMVVGAWLALQSREGSPLLAWLQRRRRLEIAAGYLLGLGIIATVSYAPLPTSRLIAGFSRLAIAFFFAFVIWEQNDSEHSLFKAGKLRALTRLGRISYGLYCLHFLGILGAIYLDKLVLHFNRTWWQVMFVETALALTITIVLSVVSYTVLEKPFLRLKDRFAFAQKSAA